MSFDWLPLVLAAETAGEAGERGFGLNPDILGTNLLNVLIVLGLLFWVGRGYLGRVLGERRAELERSIQEVNNRAQEAEQQLTVARNNLASAQAQAQQILAEARGNAQRVRTQVLEQAQRDIVQVRENAERELAAEQQRVLVQIRNQVIGDALARLRERLPGELNTDTQRRLLDRSISLLD